MTDGIMHMLKIHIFIFLAKAKGVIRIYAQTGNMKELRSKQWSKLKYRINSSN